MARGGVVNVGAAVVFILIGIVLGTIARHVDAALGREWPKVSEGTAPRVTGHVPCGMCGGAEVHRASCVIAGR
jgi:hypothetical protein